MSKVYDSPEAFCGGCVNHVAFVSVRAMLLHPLDELNASTTNINKLRNVELRYAKFVRYRS
jgi:hypothetical protein